MTPNELEQERLDVLKRMGEIRTMRRGSVSEQFLKVAHKGKAEPVARGPYYLWQYWEEGKPVRRRLKGGPEVAAARREVAAHKRFEHLCDQYVHIAESLAEVERGPECSADSLKKGLKSRSSRTSKSSE